ncbi:MAG: alginate export family protein [Fimbriimonas sp.]
MTLWTLPMPGPSDTVRLKPVFEARLRLERRVDRDLVESSNDNRSDLFGRTRLGVEYEYDGWKGRVVYQVASDEAWTPDHNGMTERRDLLLAFAERKVGAGTLTVGRQRIKVGSERLFGESNWNNISIAHDAVRYRAGEWEVFAGKPGVAPRPRSTARFAGASIRRGGGETLAAFSHDSPGAPDADRWILDHNQKFTAGPVAIEVEAAGQAGHDAGGSVDAWALAAKASVPVAPKLSAFLQGNLATSDFDLLYPSGHGRNGIMDLQGWRNAQNFGVGLKFKATPKLDVNLEWNALALKDATDPWYGNTGATYKRPGGAYVDPTGASGRDIGQEINVEARWQAGHGFTVGAGLGLFRPGRFVRSLGGNDEQTFGYFEVGYKF